MGRCKNLGSLKLFFHLHLSYPGPVYCVFSHPELPWGSLWGVTAVLGAARWQLFIPFLVPLGSGNHTGGLQLLMTVTSLFTDWQETVQFSQENKAYHWSQKTSTEMGLHKHSSLKWPLSSICSPNIYLPTIYHPENPNLLSFVLSTIYCPLLKILYSPKV